MSYSDLYEEVVMEGQSVTVRLIDLVDCEAVTMTVVSGVCIQMAYTALWDKPRGAGWEPSVQYNTRGEQMGVIWRREMTEAGEYHRAPSRLAGSLAYRNQPRRNGQN